MPEFVAISLAFVSTGVLFTLLEKLWPRDHISYRAVIQRDLIALLVVAVLMLVAELLVAPVQTVLQSFRMFNLSECRDVMTVDFWIRLVLFYLVWDFTLYWVHRLMHQPAFWQMHKWHHHPSTLWWLSGIRASLLHLLLFEVAFLWFWLFRLPHWVYLLLAAEFIVRNGWMHLNVRVPYQRIVEWLIVTPRYHLIHHSDTPEYYNQNLGSLMTIWDRMFGTYVDPDEVDFERLRLGLHEELSVRMMIGF